MDNFTSITTATGTLPPLFFNSTVPPDVEDDSIFFVWYDYLIFCCLLCTSWGMGIYIGCFGKKQTTTNDYLHGGKQMNVLPVAISLTASHCSGVTLLAVPSEVYKFGASYWLVTISIPLVAILTNWVFLPVFYKLQLISTYEYLGLRFDKKTRKLSSFLFAVSVFSLMPVVIYIPSLALSAATGLDVHIITPVICGICIFYTTIGGLKALIWTDTVQFSLTVVAILTIMTLGFKESGGVLNAFQKAIDGHRLDIFKFDLDFTDRDSFWSMLFGFTFHWVAHTSINQGCTQKFLSVATLKECKWLVVIYCLFMVIIKSTSVINGLLIYNKFAECDPLASGRIKNNDQILPYYVLNVADSIPGLSGLFLAGVFFASLSSFSGNLNSLAGTIYEDFLKNTLERKGINKTTCVLKLLVVIIGVISVLMVYIVERLGGLMAISIALGSVAHGPLLGMFCLGLLFPRVRARGAFYGAVTGMLVMATIVMGNCYYKSKKMLRYPAQPISVDGCSVSGNSTIHHLWNATTSSNSSSVPYEVPQVFRISFYWYSLMGGCICMTIGLLITYLQREEEPYVARELLSPAIYSIIDPKKYQNKMGLDYSSVEEALNRVEMNGKERRRSSKWEAAREERLKKMSLPGITDVIDD
ncbi:unnamed protein product [Phaedon cochleariae]|uniref:Uncharacterized protein n=1 Tax=Phaedon cochleariae TaxID=80249 RepID=A0A9P0DHK7_PHACE|nr:unnamed protein product [Phaedon cochleariae]